jgi:hypothetical protein
MKKILAGCVLVAAFFATFANLDCKAAVIFFDDFNDGTANTPVTGRTAVTGQSWQGPGFGGGSMLMTTGSGQGGTLGAGSTSSGGGADNIVPLGQTLTSGAYTYEADFSILDARPRNQLFLFGPTFAAPVVTFGMGNGSVFFEGIYNGHAAVPTGFAANAVGYNIHVAMTFDLDTETGSVSWFDIDDPSDATTSGNVSLGSFTVPAGVGNYVFSRILVSESPPSAGFDNIRFSNAVPEPSSAMLAGVVAFLAIALTRFRESLV